MLKREELQEHYRQLRAELRTLLAGLTDAQLTERTLDGWSVKDHLTHLAYWDDIRADDIGRVSAGYEPAGNITEDQVEELNRIDHAMFADCTLEQARWEIDRVHQDVLAALANATERGLEPERYRNVSLQSDHEAEHIGWIRACRERMGY